VRLAVPRDSAKVTLRSFLFAPKKGLEVSLRA
jgi:hypothetical protein